MFSTCDFCDAHKDDASGAFRVLVAPWRSYGQVDRFYGAVQTVQCFEDNTPVKAAVESPGEGRVLVVDAGASMRKAVLGGNLAAAAARNNWAGLVISGCVRDLNELQTTPVGILALGHVPMPTQRRDQGLTGLAVQIGGVWVRPGEWLYADTDGVVVSTQLLH
jgi:regulator of ribonuclease activity A